MLILPVLNPHLLDLLARVRHTNRLVVADAMFPSWPGVPTLDLSLVAGVPQVPQVLAAILQAWKPGILRMAAEFRQHQPEAVQAEFFAALGGVEPEFEPHLRLKERVPGAVGLIRTGEMRIYTNVILESV